MKKFIMVVSLMTLLGCKKNDKSNVLQFQQTLDKLLDEKNYTVDYRKSINDSIHEFRGFNKNYILTGVYNKQPSEKTDWWTLYDRKKNKLLKVEFLDTGEKIIKNQIIFYNNKNIDTLSSKFYEKLHIDKKKIMYKFYTPINQYSDSKLYTHLIYAFYTDKNNIQKKDLELKKNGSHSEAIISIPEQKNLFKAVFIEREINAKNSSEGINQIFIEDTIK